MGSRTLGGNSGDGHDRIQDRAPCRGLRPHHEPDSGRTPPTGLRSHNPGGHFSHDRCTPGRLLLPVNSSPITRPVQGHHSPALSRRRVEPDFFAATERSEMSREKVTLDTPTSRRQRRPSEARTIEHRGDGGAGGWSDRRAARRAPYCRTLGRWGLLPLHDVCLGTSADSRGRRSWTFGRRRCPCDGFPGGGSGFADRGLLLG